MVQHIEWGLHSLGSTLGACERGGRPGPLPERQLPGVLRGEAGVSQAAQGSPALLFELRSRRCWSRGGWAGLLPCCGGPATSDTVAGLQLHQFFRAAAGSTLATLQLRAKPSMGHTLKHKHRRLLLWHACACTAPRAVTAPQAKVVNWLGGQGARLWQTASVLHIQLSLPSVMWLGVR